MHAPETSRLDDKFKSRIGGVLCHQLHPLLTLCPFHPTGRMSLALREYGVRWNAGGKTVAPRSPPPAPTHWTGPVPALPDSRRPL